MTSRHRVIFFIVLCILTGLGSGAFIAWKFKISLPITEQIFKEKKDYESSSAHLLFVGDLMLDRGVELSVKNNMGEDFEKLFEHIGDYFKKADVVFLNLEGPVTSVGENAGSKYSFQMNEKIPAILAKNNISIVSFANNHIGDRSVLGFTRTLENLNTSKILYTGAGKNKPEASSVKIITIRGQKIGFIGCSDVGPEWMQATETTPGILLCNDPNLTTIITDSKSKVDFLVFSAHWGNEYQPRTARQQSIAHQVIDAGADMVIGHHPHVIQETEWYNGKFIAYSLGNFIFDQSFSSETMRGLLVDATIHQGKITGIILKTIELDTTNNKYQPVIIRDTTDSDFLVKETTKKPICPIATNNTHDLWLAPVGPNFGIDTKYIPDHLVLLKNYATTSADTLCLNASASNKLEQMITAMKQKNLSIIISSAFRTADYQNHLHDTSESKRDHLVNPYPSVAIPGHSEHQLGLAVDIVAKPNYTLADFKNTAEYQWLVNNAYQYGFVQSYPLGKESVTGYQAEEWHWRYVGLEHAKNIHDQDITPYEYLQNLAK